MRNRKLIIFLTIIITLLCLYNLSFTFIARNVQQEATEKATNKDGSIDLNKKQKYLEAVYNKPVFNLLGLEYTYKEVKDHELGLGLDLQGGMHVVLEVSPVDILKALAGSSANTDIHFKQALEKAKVLQRTTQESFLNSFYASYKEINPDRPLAAIFSNTYTREKGIQPNASDDEVKKVINQEVAESIDRAEKIIRTRIDKFGVVSPNIQRLPSGRIQLELPGVENPQRVRNLLQGVAQLEFLPVLLPQEAEPILLRINDYRLAIEKQGKNQATKKTTVTEKNNALFDSAEVAQSDTTKLLSDSAVAKADTLKKTNDTADIKSKFSTFLTLQKGPMAYSVNDTAAINDVLNDPKVKSMIPSNVMLLWEKASANQEKPGDAIVELVPVRKEKGPNALTGESVVNAKYDVDQKRTGKMEVVMVMNDEGARKWKNITRDAARDHRRIAIVLDKVVYSAPSVNEEIPGGVSSITGNFTLEEAKDLSLVLETGKLPAPVNIVEEVIVGPTLGKEAISAGLKSMLAGMIVVILFMLLYYSRSGLVADIALLFNLLFIVGVMANLNAVLTLPGIAGILLSIAIAVDANVLINERVKEDLNEGKSVDTAINSGYKNASSAILDSNITTLIKGFVLLYFGTGLILGFAVTLIIGIFCSLFTSVLITRVIFSLRKNQNISFSSNWSKNLFKKIHIDFIGKRKIYYAVSTLVIIAGIVSFVMKGVNLGVDFKGGRSYIVQFDKPVSSEDLKKNLGVEFGGAPEVKTYGSNNQFKITTTYLVEDESESATAQAEEKLNAGLAKVSGVKSEVLRTSKVGPTIADDIKTSAVWALVVAIVLMFLYILIRFKKFEFGFGAMVSLVHVVLVVLSVFSILDGIVPFSLELDQAFVAAILTVIGYSINDSVVVFDRIREFLAIHKGNTNTSQVINDALNDTLSRTLITGMSTIFVIIILFVFGGETIKGFSFAMLIGVLVGTYSSLCIGSPVLVDFANWRSRKDKTAATA